MNAHIWSGLMIMSLCAVLASRVGAQERSDVQERFDDQENFPSVASDNRIDALSSRLRGRSDFSNIGREWIAELERAGIVNRSLHGPYRVAVPLMAFGETGPKVMITYARKLPGTSGAKGVLLFINIPIP